MQKVNVTDTNIIEIEKTINDTDIKKSNINGHLLKLITLIECFNSFVSIATEKLEIWNIRKENIDIILANFDFYLLVISCYIHYVAPLSYNQRKLYKEYLYSFAEKLNLKIIKQLDIYSIFLEVLVSSNKDNELCFYWEI